MSTNWNHGYYASEGYEYGYHPHTSPAHIQWACTLQGIKAPKSDFTYLDLGCGQGLDLILHAAIHPDSKFIGVDFMPTHIAHARGLAEKLGLTNVIFIEEDFLNLAKDPYKLGEVDYAVAHGISAWISTDIRNAMWELVGKVLKPGGVVYNTYNTYPHWYTMAPFQHLVAQLNQSMSGTKAVKEAIQKFGEIEALNSPLFKTLPLLKGRLGKLPSFEPAYLNQEYNNKSWEPKHVADMLNEVQAYKLDYIGTANLMQAIKSSYDLRAYDMIQSESSIPMRETIRDLILCQAFRYDLYGKGTQTLWHRDHQEAMGCQRFINIKNCELPETESFTISYNMMTVNFSRNEFQEVLNAFGNEGKSVKEVHEALGKHTIQTIAEMATYLYQGDWLSLTPDQPHKNTVDINRKIANLHLTGAPYNYVVQSKTQQAVRLNNSNMMLLALHLNGTPNGDLPQELKAVMRNLNRSYVINGREVANDAEFMEHAEFHTNNFLTISLRQIF